MRIVVGIRHVAAGAGVGDELALVVVLVRERGQLGLVVGVRDRQRRPRMSYASCVMTGVVSTPRHIGGSARSGANCCPGRRRSWRRSRRHRHSGCRRGDRPANCSRPWRAKLVSAVICATSCRARSPTNSTVHGPPGSPVTLTLPAPMLGSASSGRPRSGRRNCWRQPSGQLGIEIERETGAIATPETVICCTSLCVSSPAVSRVVATSKSGSASVARINRPARPSAS